MVVRKEFKGVSLLRYRTNRKAATQSGYSVSSMIEKLRQLHLGCSCLMRTRLLTEIGSFRDRWYTMMIKEGCLPLVRLQ